MWMLAIIESSAALATAEWHVLLSVEGLQSDAQITRIGAILTNKLI